MATIKSYRDLVVWQRAMDLATRIYELTKSFPRQEEYRITAQMIRAAISIPANIAEGYVRNTRKDYANFIGIARGSSAELETLLMLTSRSKIAPVSEVEPTLALNEEVSRMLNVLRQRLSSPQNLKPKP